MHVDAHIIMCPIGEGPLLSLEGVEPWRFLRGAHQAGVQHPLVGHAPLHLVMISARLERLQVQEMARELHLLEQHGLKYIYQPSSFALREARAPQAVHVDESSRYDSIVRGLLSPTIQDDQAPELIPRPGFDAGKVGVVFVDLLVGRREVDVKCRGEPEAALDFEAASLESKDAPRVEMAADHLDGVLLVLAFKVVALSDLDGSGGSGIDVRGVEEVSLLPRSVRDVVESYDGACRGDEGDLDVVVLVRPRDVHLLKQVPGCIAFV